MVVKEETLVAEGILKEEKNCLKTAKVKMDEVREENQRLKLTLSQMMKSYNSLKMQFNDIVKEDDHNQPKIIKSSDNDSAPSGDKSEPFVSLSLGRSFSGDHYNRSDEKSIKMTDYKYSKHDGLELGLDCKFHSAAGNSTHDDHHQVLSKNLTRSRETSSSDESKDEAGASRKSLKISRSGDDHEILQLQNPLKKPRVSVRAVCNTQTMHDGCQWRKYGQKISKGNPCPRAYYRCTVSPSCPVRKQVQRCMDDMTILITTYEGAHNHPLPPAATTMASATSAAASMLNSGSTTSAASSTGLGFNFTSSNSFPRATICTSQSHPTVILDLTPPNHSLNNNNNKLFSSSSSTLFSSPSSLNFSSSSNWETKFSSMIKNGASSSSYNSQPFIYNNFSQQDQITSNDHDHKFAAATKAITRDPTFQSALAAAITSFVGNNVQGRSNSGLNFDLLSFTQPSTSNGSKGCATSFLNKFPQSSSVEYQHNNLTHFAPLTLMSKSKTQAMVSLADEAHEQIKLL